MQKSTKFIQIINNELTEIISENGVKSNEQTTVIWRNVELQSTKYRKGKSYDMRIKNQKRKILICRKRTQHQHSKKSRIYRWIGQNKCRYKSNHSPLYICHWICIQLYIREFGKRLSIMREVCESFNLKYANDTKIKITYSGLINFVIGQDSMKFIESIYVLETMAELLFFIMFLPAKCCVKAYESRTVIVSEQILSLKCGISDNIMANPIDKLIYSLCYYSFVQSKEVLIKISML